MRVARGRGGGLTTQVPGPPPPCLEFNKFLGPGLPGTAGAEAPEHLFAHDRVAAGRDVIQIARRRQGRAADLACGSLQPVEDSAAEAHFPVSSSLQVVDGLGGAGQGAGATGDAASPNVGQLRT